MSKEIISETIGRLEQNAQFSDWWHSAKIAIPFFDDEKLPITFIDFEPENDKTFINEGDNALTNFLRLTIENRNTISSLVYKNCTDFLDMIDEDETDDKLRAIKNPNEIWSYVYPFEICVKRHTKDKNIYIQVLCNCDWEPEHGLQFVFREGKDLVRVSEQDGHLT